MSAIETTDTAAVVEPVTEVKVEQPKVEQPKTDETAGTEQQATDDTADSMEKPKRPIQPRINELTRAAREAEREAAYWRGIAEGKSGTPAQAAPEAKPTPDKFEDYGAYVEALTDWKTEQALKKHSAALEQKTQATTRQTTWEKAQDEFRSATPDYDEVLANADHVPVKPHVFEALQDAKSPALAYHLAQNPDALLRMNQMDQRAVDREIGRLEAQLVKPAASSAAPRTTNAPPPVKPVSQGRSNITDLSKANMDEYVAQRRKEGATWAR